MPWSILVESYSNFSKSFGISVSWNSEEKGMNDAEKASNKYELASALFRNKETRIECDSYMLHY